MLDYLFRMKLFFTFCALCLGAQLYAAEALGKLGSARAITPLLEVANDPSRDKVRTVAKTALTRLGWQNDIVEPVQPTPQDEPQNGSRIAEEI